MIELEQMFLDDLDVDVLVEIIPNTKLLEFKVSYGDYTIDEALEVNRLKWHELIT